MNWERVQGLPRHSRVYKYWSKDGRLNPLVAQCWYETWKIGSVEHKHTPTHRDTHPERRRAGTDRSFMLNPAACVPLLRPVPLTSSPRCHVCLRSPRTGSGVRSAAGIPEEIRSAEWGTWADTFTGDGKDKSGRFIAELGPFSHAGNPEFVSYIMRPVCGHPAFGAAGKQPRYLCSLLTF